MAFLEIHRDAAVFRNRAGQDLSRQRRLQVTLKITLQRPRAVYGVIALTGDVILRCLGQFQFEVPIA